MLLFTQPELIHTAGECDAYLSSNDTFSVMVVHRLECAKI